MIYLGKIAQFVDNGSDREFGALHRAQIQIRPDAAFKQPQQGLGTFDDNNLVES